MGKGSLNEKATHEHNSEHIATELATKQHNITLTHLVLFDNGETCLRKLSVAVVTHPKGTQ